MITAATRTYVLLGDPVAHSLSPAMQNAAFKALGLDAVYAALRVEADLMAPVLRAVARAGGGGNVTVPHKSRALAAVDLPTPVAEAAGACNTFWSDAGRVVGDNTDVAGIVAAMEALGSPDGPWLLIGTGGSARAAAIAARERGTAIAVRSRDPERGLGFLQWAASRGVARVAPAACRVVVNCSPLGLRRDDPLPLPLDACAGATAALDLVYGPQETPWVRELRARGVQAADGRGVLIAQGAAALERWFPGRRAPRELMRAAVDGRLR